MNKLPYVLAFFLLQAGDAHAVTNSWYRDADYVTIILLSLTLIVLLVGYIIHRHIVLEKLVAGRTQELEEVNASLFREHKALESMLNDKNFLWEIASTLNSTSSTFDELVTILDLLYRKMDISHLIVLDQSVEIAHQPFSAFLITKSGVREITGEVEKFPIRIMDALDMGQSYFCSEKDRLDPEEMEFFNSYGIQSICIFPSLRLNAGLVGLYGFGKQERGEWQNDQVQILEAVSSMLLNAWWSYREFHGRLAAEKKQTEAIKVAEKSVRMASIGIIAAGITHEINQPLNTLNIVTENVLRDLDREKKITRQEYRTFFESIYSQIQRIEEIITYMRELWDSPVQREQSLFDLNESARNALSLIDAQIHSHGIGLEVKLRKKPLRILGNRIHLEQIVINLAVNAMQALDDLRRENKIIRVTTRQADGWGMLAVEDNGRGIPEELRDNIFEPLFSTRKPRQGMGLGLAIVKRFVDEMGGTIEVGASRENGAKISILFPPVSSWDGEYGNSSC